jgi:hypothetical protein
MLMRFEPNLNEAAAQFTAETREDAEITQRRSRKSLRHLRVLCVSAVNLPS